MDVQSSTSASQPTISTLSRTAFTAVCRQLEEFIRSEKTSASFACGGTIPVKKTVGDAEDAGTVKSSGPINVFWKLKSEAQKLTLPLGSSVDAEDGSDTRLRQLVADCEPAGFGRGQETVMDSKYRKARKLETSRFATSFHPADFGIIERVEQVLLPTLDKLDEGILQIRRMHIELYKLNVYSGPSGLFKSHVDTPRSKNQIGSLVVCLPSPFKGGNLIVRHEGREVDFDWEHQSADTIQWAAFYSDCDHEIKTITDGDRITLTYNLYAVTELLDRANQISAIIDPKSFPLYGFLKDLLMMPGFMKTGGVLGAFCSHAYPHASEDASALLPRGLKGADLVLYSVLHSLGIEVDVLPVMIGHGYLDIEDDWWDSDEYTETDPYPDPYPNPSGHSDNDNGNRYDDDARVDYSSFSKDDQKVRKVQKVKVNSPYAYVDPGKKVHVGKSLNPYVAADTYEDQPFAKILKEHWSTREYEKPITWVTTPLLENIKHAMAYLAYGNEASQARTYSYAAILAVIPAWNERQQLLERVQNE
ncbi:hypothetical protein PENSUB_8055 [Penicillium subrubescens]|uniref:Fe2OG dioxygenase domain-containing protein n=2 Tax=Penicillium subrubescens TaxID=1316194 RepID=A0A1Q5THY6_9EURO|nr:hypothetical protein PENSUB_8055 [Penicillium subrubescens]